MRKLLLVLLVPIMVLGVMGCGGKIDEDVQTDYLIQGAWVLDEYTLYISSAQMVVKYYTAVSTPYRTEWSYDTDPVDRDLIEGELAVFDYHTNNLLATLTISCIPGESLEILDPIDWEVDAYYYANAFPIVGLYAPMVAEGSGKETEGEETEDAPTAESYSIANEADLVFDGTAKAVTLTTTISGAAAENLKYYGVTKAGEDYGSDTAPLAAAPTDAGEYTVVFDTAGTAPAAKGLKKTFTIDQYQLENDDFEYTGETGEGVYDSDLDVALITSTWKSAGAISDIAVADTSITAGNDCPVTFTVADSADGNCKGGDLEVSFTVTP